MQEPPDGTTNESGVKLALAIVAAVLVVQAPAHGRQVEGFTITPAGASKTFEAIPASNPLHQLVPPTYEECRDDYPVLMPSCDFVPVHIDAGRPAGYDVTITLEWPNQPANNLDMILWNRETRETECFTLDPRENRFCGAEGRSIGLDHPERLELIDLPAGDYVLTVINGRGTNSGYTVSGEITFV